MSLVKVPRSLSHFTILASLLHELVLAQQGDSSSPADTDTTPTSTATGFNATDSAGANSNPHTSENTVSLVNYYFVFLALVVCIAGLAAFLMYRRKRKYGAFLRSSRENALQRDVGAWDPTRARRRYWQGRWRSTDDSREEGLNEYGEAPPPYVPKSREDEQEAAVAAANGLAVPMQALSREQAGLMKPPDYAEAYAAPVNEDITDMRRPEAGATPSQPQPPHTSQRFAS